MRKAQFFGKAGGVISLCGLAPLREMLRFESLLTQRRKGAKKIRKLRQHRLALRLAAPALSVFTFLSPSYAQQPTPTPEVDEIIRVKTDLVQLQAVITDRSGRAVDNLTQADFEVLENGKPQKISFFTMERILGSSATGAPGQTGDLEIRTPARKKISRTIVICVDTLHLSPASLVRAKQQLKKFVDEQVTDEDMVAVVTTSWSLGILQQFIKDRKLLRYAIDRISVFPKRSTLFTPYLAARVTMQDEDALAVATQILTSEEGLPSPPAMVEQRARFVLEEEAMLRKSTLQVLAGVSDRLAEMPGQRLIAFLSDGFTMLEDGNSSAGQDLTAATSRAARRGVVLYAFEPAGLAVPIEFQASTRLGGADLGRFMSDSLVDAQSTLKQMAGDTGGEAYLNNNDLGGMFRKMLAANQIYYSLAYYPPSESDKPKFRNITVRLRNHPDYKIRTQRGYQAMPAAKTAVALTPRQKLVEAMMSPLPVTGIDLDSSASFLERGDDDNQVTLQVHIAGTSLEYQPRGQKFALSCEIAVAVISQAGKISENFGQGLKGELTAKQLEVAKQNGYRYEKRLKLDPGMYQVRVGVRDVKGELMGTSTSWVVVPDLRKQKLALSSIFLGKKPSAEENIKLQEAGAGSSVQPTLVIGRRAFKKGEPLFYRFVVYNPTKGDSSLMQVRVEVVRGDTPLYEGPWQPLAARSIRSDQTGIEAGGELTLGLDPGVYTLRVAIKDGKSKATTQQTIDFELE